MNQTEQSTLSYTQEEVTFENKSDNITLSGTLTLSQTHPPFAAVVLIAGMGPHNRDYAGFGRNMFRIIAEHLTKNGIAVLRYDKRGVGSSTGTFDGTVTSEQLSYDAEAAVEFLKNQNIAPNKIGLLGHSEGGMIATMIAARRNDIFFVVSMAGAVSTSPEALISQMNKQMAADGASKELIEQDRIIRTKVLSIAQENTDTEQAINTMKKSIDLYWKQLPQSLQEESLKFLFAFTPEKSIQHATMLASPGYHFLMHYDQTRDLQKIKCPFFALYGDKDFIASPSIALPILRENLIKTDFKTLLEIPNTNHSFQQCITGSMQEYMTLENTIATSVLETVSNWIINL